MRDNILEARDVQKSYGAGEARFQALRGVSLDIRYGESVAIVGKSGSGKSTLMHLLALLDTPDSGVIAVDGAATKERSPKALNTLRNETFGFVFQQFFMIPNATVLDNVVLPLKIAGMPKRERTTRGMEVLEQVEMADKAANRATALSGGQKQRMVIARALANRPKVIFADEPTGNLDSTTGGVVTDLLFTLNAQEGMTLVIVTHDEDLAARCDVHFAITDGRISNECAPMTMVRA
jgi:putative ABC transport system ATP-binding protein